jgi:predicted transcriptional regulator of viral defense system
MTKHDRYLRVSQMAQRLLKTRSVITTDMVAHHVNCSSDEARAALEILGKTGTLTRISADRYEAPTLPAVVRRPRWRV